MSIIAQMAVASDSAIHSSLANTNWVFTYSGSTGTLSFAAGGAGIITYPNGQSFPLYWCESGGHFWISISAFAGWFELIEGSHSSGRGSGNLVESNMSSSNAQVFPFTMSKKA